MQVVSVELFVDYNDISLCRHSCTVQETQRDFNPRAGADEGAEEVKGDERR